MQNDLMGRPASASGSNEEVEQLIRLASQYQQQAQLDLAATAYDLAYAMRPGHAQIQESRARLLEELSFEVQGLRFRYVPGGTFIMGSQHETDEQPPHAVELQPFWMAETPISWSYFCTIMDWSQPPEAVPHDMAQREDKFSISVSNRIRLQYCEDYTITARDWHSHMPDQQWTQAGKTVTSRELFGPVPREPNDRPWGYALKPMVAVSWQMAMAFSKKLGQRCKGQFALPTEAQWERAARGGLAGTRYAWGDEPPNSGTCDFNRFDRFSIQPMKKFAPNGYGLYATCGGVWEWTADWYDGGYYTRSPVADPSGPDDGKERVMRGGSWADCAEAVAVSFRNSLETGDGQRPRGFMTPNIGFRVCCISRSQPSPPPRTSFFSRLFGKRSPAT